jgi:hypothetical protein
MRQQVSTVLDDALFRRAKFEAMRRGKPLEAILEEALERYLDEKGTPAQQRGAVTASWGVLKLDKKDVRNLLAEEDGFLRRF